MSVFSDGESKGTTFYFKIKMEQPCASRLREFQNSPQTEQLKPFARSMQALLNGRLQHKERSSSMILKDSSDVGLNQSG